MDQFIKYVKALEPIVKSRRESMHSSTKSFLREQRATLFSAWEAEMFKLMSTGRGVHGKYSSRKDHIDEQPRKKERQPVFDFTSLMDPVFDFTSNACENRYEC